MAWTRHELWPCHGLPWMDSVIVHQSFSHFFLTFILSFDQPPTLRESALLPSWPWLWAPPLHRLLPRRHLLLLLLEEAEEEGGTPASFCNNKTYFPSANPKNLNFLWKQNWAGTFRRGKRKRSWHRTSAPVRSLKFQLNFQLNSQLNFQLNFQLIFQLNFTQLSTQLSTQLYSTYLKATISKT